MREPVSRRRRTRRGAGIARWAVRILVALVLFAAGIAVGQALEDEPAAGGAVTSYATIQPWTQTGRATVTQTVTVEPRR